MTSLKARVERIERAAAIVSARALAPVLEVWFQDAKDGEPLGEPVAAFALEASNPARNAEAIGRYFENSVSG